MGVASSQPTVQVLTPRVTTLEDLANTDKAYVSGVSFRLSDVAATVFTQTGRVDTLETTVNTLSVQNTALAGRFEKYNGDFAALSDRAFTLSRQVWSLSDYLVGPDQLSSKLDAVNKLVTAYDRTGMLDSITAINATATGINTTVNTISSNVWTLSGNLSTNTVSFGRLSTSVSNLNISYATINTRITTNNTTIGNVNMSVSLAYSSGVNYATQTNQIIANYAAMFDGNISTLSFLITTNAAAANAAANAVSLVLSNAIMSLSAYVAVLDQRVTAAQTPNPKIYTPGAPSTTADGKVYSLFIDPATVPTRSIVYSQNAGNVNFFTTGYNIGYTIYVVNYASTTLGIATTWLQTNTANGLTGTGVTQPAAFFFATTGMPSAVNTVNIPAGKTATFVWVGTTPNGPWAVTFTA
jgi:hypothetical protein